MADCVSTIASKAANYQDLQAAKKTLGMAKDATWWEYPTLYQVASEYVWGDEGREDGILFRPPTVFQVDFYLKNDVEAIPDKLRAIKGELGSPGGDLKFTPARIEDIRQSLDRAIEELGAAISTPAMRGGYGGRSTGMLPDAYFITFGEYAEVKYVRAQLSVASSQVDQILSILFASNCSESEGGEDCERIADALERLADKDMTCEGLDKIAAAVGADALAAGVTVPRLVTEEDGGGTETIDSIPAFIRWQFLQMDALIGRFPLKIKATDTEADETGDQEREYIAPNLSEAIANLTALAVTTDTTTDATLRASLATMSEAILTRKLLIQCREILNNLEEWASYTVGTETKDVPFAADIRKKRIDEALQACVIPVQVTVKKTEKKSPDFDIERIGKIVNTIYAIVSAVHVHRLDPDDPATGIKADLEKRRQLTDDEDEDDFSTWLERTEIEFSDGSLSHHQTDPAPTGVTPYGRPYSRRPRIRQTEGQGTEDINGDNNNVT